MNLTVLVATRDLKIAMYLQPLRRCLKTFIALASGLIRAKKASRSNLVY